MLYRLSGILSPRWQEREIAKAKHEKRHPLYEPRYSRLEILWKFVFSVETLLELLAIVPFFVLVGISSYFRLNAYTSSFLRIFRLFRVFRLSKSIHVEGMETIFQRTMAASRDALQLLAIAILIATVVLGCIQYFVERGTLRYDDSTQEWAHYVKKMDGTYAITMFDSIPTAMYWALITLTTVGYGEIRCSIEDYTV